MGDFNPFPFVSYLLVTPTTIAQMPQTPRICERTPFINV